MIGFPDKPSKYLFTERLYSYRKDSSLLSLAQSISN